MARELRNVRVGDLTWEHGAQRMEMPTRVDLKRFAVWDENKVGVGIASERDGRIYPLDGRTRAYAAMQQFGPEYRMPFLVHTDLTPEIEATIFDAANNARKDPSPMDSYMVGIYGGRSPYVEIDAQLRKHGLSVGKSSSNRKVGAVKALANVYTSHGEPVLESMLDVLLQTYAYDDEKAWDSAVMQAVAHLIALNRHIDLDRLSKALATRTAQQWKTTGMRLIGHGGGSSSRSQPIAEQMASVYNLRLRNESHRIVARRR